MNDVPVFICGTFYGLSLLTLIKLPYRLTFLYPFIFILLVFAGYSCSCLTGCDLDMSQPCTTGEFSGSIVDCSKYYWCVNGNWLEQNCPAGLMYNPAACTCGFDTSFCNYTCPTSVPELNNSSTLTLPEITETTTTPGTKYVCVYSFISSFTV